jgi:hypothetical protein
VNLVSPVSLESLAAKVLVVQAAQAAQAVPGNRLEAWAVRVEWAVRVRKKMIATGC